MRFARLIVICAAAVVLSHAAPSAAQAPTCDNAAVRKLVSATTGTDEERTQAELACPVPHGLLGAHYEQVLEHPSAHGESETRAALKNIADRLSSSYGEWGKTLASKLIASSGPAKPDKPRETGFVDVKPISSRSDAGGCDCAFATDRSGGLGRVCVRLSPPGAPPAPQCSVPVQTFASWDHVAPLFHMLELAHGGLIRLDAPARAAASDALDTAGKKWDGLRKNGYLQYPWELFASRAVKSYRDYQRCFIRDAACGKGDDDGLSPHWARLIFAHPSIGIAFTGFGSKHDTSPTAKAVPAFNLEVLGLNLYNKKFAYYFGLSTAVSFVGLDFGAPWLGGFAHLTRYVHVGYVYCVAGSHHYDGSLLLTFDVSSWVGKWMNKTFNEQLVEND